ncbi:MAG: aminoglycoside phosphotransferase family protein [Rhodospirillaceae bacterium]|nr:aminoglycoside phosphotransferase family protein [Rhodospirillaceae bacterium]
MPDEVSVLAQRLLGSRPDRIVPVGGGGNNRIYRVDTVDGPVALKGYRVDDGDDRDRLGQEWAALTLISPRLPDSVPRPIARDRTSGWAAYEWIAGDKVETVSDSDIDAAVAFVRNLQTLRNEPGAADLRLASEACLSMTELSTQIGRRLGRLAGIEPIEPFLAEIRKTFAALAGDGPELPADRRILSPSDFGFHNALRRADGRLVFLDFEYFGWDDPAKLASDTHWHPGMALGPSQRARFAAGLESVFGADPGYRERLRSYRPLIGLRWCLILLNEFLPAGLARRRHAGQAEDVEAARNRQLAKARALYSEVIQGL